MSTNEELALATRTELIAMINGLAKQRDQAKSAGDDELVGEIDASIAALEQEVKRFNAIHNRLNDPGTTTVLKEINATMAAVMTRLEEMGTTVAGFDGRITAVEHKAAALESQLADAAAKFATGAGAFSDTTAKLQGVLDGTPETKDPDGNVIPATPGLVATVDDHGARLTKIERHLGAETDADGNPVRDTDGTLKFRTLANKAGGIEKAGPALLIGILLGIIAYILLVGIVGIVPGVVLAIAAFLAATGVMITLLNRKHTAPAR